MANKFYGVKPTGKLGDTAEAQVRELITEHTPPLPQVQRLTLTADTAISTTDWDTNQVVTLVITQGGAGKHRALHAGEEVLTDPTAGAPTITAWVHDGEKWVWRSSYAEPLLTATTPPAWAPGTSLRLGAVTHSSVEAIASVDIPAGWVQYRAGASDAWRAATRQGARSIIVNGLSPASTYPAFEYRLANAAGGSTAIALPSGFQTEAKPKGWETIKKATFTTDGEVNARDYIPEIGGKLTLLASKSDAIVADGSAFARHNGTNYADSYVGWSSLGIPDKKIKVTAKYSRLVSGFFTVEVGSGNPSVKADISTTGITYNGASTATKEEYTGPVPEAGTIVLEMVDDVMKVFLDGALKATFTITQWWAGSKPYYDRASVSLNSSRIHTSNPEAAFRLDEVEIAQWA